MGYDYDIKKLIALKCPGCEHFAAYCSCNFQITLNCNHPDGGHFRNNKVPCVFREVRKDE